MGINKMNIWIIMGFIYVMYIINKINNNKINNSNMLTEFNYKNNI